MSTSPEDSTDRETTRITALYGTMFGSAVKKRGRGRPRKPRLDRHGHPIARKRKPGGQPKTGIQQWERMEQLWTWYALVALRWAAHRQQRKQDPIAYAKAKGYDAGEKAPRTRALKDVAKHVGKKPDSLHEEIRTARRRLKRDPHYAHLVAAFSLGREVTHAFVWRSGDGMIIEPVLVQFGDVFKFVDPMAE